MDKCRQQNVRYQRNNGRSRNQQNMNYGSDYKMNCACNKGYSASDNQYMNNNMCPEDCPGMGRDQLSGMPLGMAYVPWQQFGNLYEECEAVYHGTIFHDLDLDFCGMRCE